mmetsp:Transcript_10714/g.40268  ORF Transcript_10714/g.40268 Transcript_10714/m.40268 type:complete len:202 (+) Transcript_10714:166-771(+)
MQPTWLSSVQNALLVRMSSTQHVISGVDSRLQNSPPQEPQDASQHTSMVAALLGAWQCSHSGSTSCTIPLAHIFARCSLVICGRFSTRTSSTARRERPLTSVGALDGAVRLTTGHWHPVWSTEVQGGALRLRKVLQHWSPGPALAQNRPPHSGHSGGQHTEPSTCLFPNAQHVSSFKGQDAAAAAAVVLKGVGLAFTKAAT